MEGSTKLYFLFFIVVVGLHECYAIKAFGFNMDEPPWGPLGISYMEKEFIAPPGTLDISVCQYIRVHFLYTIKSFIVVLTPVSFGVARRHGFSVGNIDQALLTNDYNIIFRKWSHVCFVIGMNLQLIIDGTPIPMSPMSNASPMPVGVSGNFTVSIGMPEGTADPRQSAGAGGLFTSPVVLFRAVTATEATSMASCGVAPLDNVGDGDWSIMWGNPPINVTDVTIGYDLNTFNNAPTTELSTGNYALIPPHVQAYEVNNGEVCPPHVDEDFYLVQQVLDYYESDARCKSIGGRLLMLNDTQYIDASVQVFFAANVQGSYYVYSETNPCNCMVYEAMSFLTCSDKVQYFSCMLPLDGLLTLRGEELKRYVTDTMYFYPDDKDFIPTFFSVNGWSIKESGGYLEMYDPNDVLAFKTVDPSMWAPGRQVWRPMSGIGGDMTLLLSMCKDDEFTCNNGLCIPMSLRCDGKDDCNDDSDETCVYLLPLPGSYKKERPPIVRTPLSVTVTLISVVDINVADNIIKLWLKMDSRWEDERVDLWLLNEDKQDNQIMSDMLWVPTFRLENAIFRDSLAYAIGTNSRTKVVAERNGPPVPILKNGYEGYQYEGVLEKQEEMTVSYVCEFDLKSFPFGMYECRVNITIINSGSYTPIFNETNFMQVSTKNDLSLFETTELRYQFVDGHRGANMLSLRILVKAKFESYILTMFMPCWVIGVIGYLTLFYDKNNFSDRIMVTLSCLIVVAALLSQVSSTMPMSATSKAIDRFFLYFIMRLFVVYIHHAGLFLMTTYVKRLREKKEMRERQDHPPVALDVLENKMNFGTGKGFSNNKIAPCAAVYVPANLVYKPPNFMQRKKDPKTGEYIVPKSTVRPWDDYFNWCGLLIGAIVDFISGIVFLAEIINSRNEVSDRFYAD